MTTVYWTVAVVTFAIILNAFLRDRATRKINLKAWAFIMIATLLWPITLPFIISSKLRTAQSRQKNSEHANKESNTRLTSLQTAPATGKS